MLAQGTVFKYGDNVDTDVIIPARYLNMTDAAELAAHAMEDIDATFVKNVKPGDIIVAGSNFGCGSSREHAPLVLKHCGVACIIAPSFARIFYRNAINIGLPILECEAAARAIEAGDEVRIDFATGIIEDLTRGETFNAQPFPAFIQNIIDHDGLINSIRGEAGTMAKVAPETDGSHAAGEVGVKAAPDTPTSQAADSAVADTASSAA